MMGGQINLNGLPCAVEPSIDLQKCWLALPAFCHNIPPYLHAGEKATPPYIYEGPYPATAPSAERVSVSTRAFHGPWQPRSECAGQLFGASSLAAEVDTLSLWSMLPGMSDHPYICRPALQPDRARLSDPHGS